MESTYGDRTHRSLHDTAIEGREIIAKAIQNKAKIRHLEYTPLLLVGKMWPGLVDWVRESMLSFETPLISSEDVEIPVCVANADEAIAFIKRHKEAQTFQPG